MSLRHRFLQRIGLLLLQPRFAPLYWAGSVLGVFILIGGSVWQVYEGVQRGRIYGQINEAHEEKFIVSHVTNLVARTTFPRLAVVGMTAADNENFVVDVFRDDYRSLRPGDEIVVYATGFDQPRYVYKEKLNESKPIFTCWDFRFSWHFLVGIVGNVLFGIVLPLSYLRQEKEERFVLRMCFCGLLATLLILQLLKHLVLGTIKAFS